MKTNLHSNYSIKAMKEIERNKLENRIKNNDYSKTLDVALASGIYNNNYFDDYLKINYIEEKDFVKKINIFLEKKYSSDEINNIYLSFSKDNIDKLLNNSYLNLSDFFGIKNFDASNYSRYINWAKDKTINLETIVTYVNIGLDKDFYSSFDEVVQTDSYTILINKYHRLPQSYEPKDLVSLSYDNKYKLRKTVANAFEELTLAAKKDNHSIAPYSAYRSYETQQRLYTNYVAKDGKELADTYSARPGFSEHQTGLAVDITTIGLVGQLSEGDYNWISQNAYKYGFIIRYPEGKIDITGYMYEDWHLRYVGIDVATAMNNTNLTFDEYYDKYLK